MKTPVKENRMTWREFYEDMRAIFADEGLRTWCGISAIVIAQSIWTLFTGDVVRGMIVIWTAAIFLQMLFETALRYVRR